MTTTMRLNLFFTALWAVLFVGSVVAICCGAWWQLLTAIMSGAATVVSYYTDDYCGESAKSYFDNLRGRNDYPIAK